MSTDKLVEQGLSPEAQMEKEAEIRRIATDVANFVTRLTGTEVGGNGEIVLRHQADRPSLVRVKPEFVFATNHRDDADYFWLRLGNSRDHYNNCDELCVRYGYDNQYTEDIERIEAEGGELVPDSIELYVNDVAAEELDGEELDKLLLLASNTLEDTVSIIGDYSVVK